MSTTIDQRVVEMRFDNKNFEHNVQTSMSTLEKLKQKLNLTGASKGIENINTAAKKINFSNATRQIESIQTASKKVDLTGIGKAADTVGLRFNAMYTIADQALRNLTTRAQHAAGQFAKAFTTEPAKTGFQEYETQIGAIQTIMANTSHQGTTLDQVNNALDTLNTYADKTIYNFTEMTRNIGTFTAAGVDLKTSVESIQGIANLAAVSGSTSQQASTAMYQLSQALAAGKLTLMDWNSVVNAGMGGKVFQDALLRTSELLKTGGKEAVKTFGSFRNSLTQGEWLTTEVLTETLKQLAGAYTEADLMSQGFTKDQAEEIAAMAKTAEEAATKVKTFTQLVDTVKESVQSGWAQSWRIIIGDFEEAKSLWSGISDRIGAMIEKSSNRRNEFLHKHLDSGWKKMTQTINEAGIETDAFNEALTKALKNKGTDVDALIEEYGSLEKAFQKGKFEADILKNTLKELTSTSINLSGIDVGLKMGDTGEDVKKVQEALQKAGQELSKFGVDGIIGEETTAAIKAFQELKGIEITGIIDDATLKALNEASKSSAKITGNIDDLVAQADELGGRQLLLSSLGTIVLSLIHPVKTLMGAFSDAGEIGAGTLIFESFVNIFKGLASVIKPIKAALSDIFDPITGDQVFGVVKGFHKLTEKFKLTGEGAFKLRETFKGLFSIVKTIWELVRDGAVNGFKAVKQFINDLDIDILGITSRIGQAVKSFSEWIRSGINLGAVFETISPYITTLSNFVKSLVENVKQFFIELWNMPKVQDAVGKVVEIFNNFKQSILDIISIMKGDAEFSETPKEAGLRIANGLVTGLFDGVESIKEAATEIAKAFIEKICNAFGADNEFGSVNEQGEKVGFSFIDGLKAIVGKVFGFVKDIATGIVDIFNGIDWRALFAAGMGIGMLLTVKKMVGILESISSPLSGIGDVMEGFANVQNSFAKKVKSEALRNIAVSIGILVASLAALTYLVSTDITSLGIAVGIIVALAVVLGGLMFAMNKLNDASVKLDKEKGLNIDGLKSGLISIGIAVALLAVAVKTIGTMSLPQAIQGFIGLGGIILAIVAVFAILGRFTDGTVAKNIDKFGVMLVKLAIAMALMVGVCKLAGTLNENDALKAGYFAAAFLVFMAGIVLVGALLKATQSRVNMIGSTMVKLTIAMGLMIGVCKLAGTLTRDDAERGTYFAVGFLAFLGALMYITKVTGISEIAKVSGTLVGISFAMILMVGLCKLVSFLEPEEIIYAIGFVAVYCVFVRVMIGILKIGSEEQIAKVGLTLLAMSAAIAVLAGVSIILGLVKLEDLAKGVAAVVVLGLVMKGMIKATQGANAVTGNIIAMAAAIAVMTIAVASLSVMDGKKLAKAVTVLTVVMLAFGKMAKSAGSMNAGVKQLLVLVGAIVILGYVLKMVGELPVSRALGSAASMSILLLAMSGAMKIMGGAKVIGPDALIGMTAMAAVVAVLGIVLGILGKFDCTVGIETATSLSILLLAMSGACVILSTMGTACTYAIAGAAALSAVIAIIGLTIAALGALVSEFPQVETFLDKGIPILEKIGKGIGKFIAGLFGGFGEGLSASFKIMMTDFSAGIRKLGTIPGSAIKGCETLVSVINTMSGVSVLDLLNMFITGEGTMALFKNNIFAFADIMQELSTKLSSSETTIDVDAINSLAASGTAFATLNKSLPRQDGWIQDIIGEQDLTKFGTSCKAFADAMVEINKSVSAEGFAFNSEAFTAMTTAGTQFKDLNAALPRTDGWIQDIVGDQDLTKFGTSCKAFADAMISINDSVSAEGFAFNSEAITAMTTAGTEFQTLNSALPKSEGWVQDILGKQDLTKFGTSVVAFAGAMISINDSVSAEGFSFNSDAFTAMTTAGTQFTDLNAALPKSEGWVQNILGEQDLTTFGASVAAFAGAMIEISKAVSVEGFSFNETAIDSMVTAGNKLAGLSTSIPKSGGWWTKIAGEQDLTDFGTKIAAYGASMKSFADSIGDGINSTAVETVKNAGTMMTELQNAIPANTWFDGKVSLDDFGSTIEKFGGSMATFSNTVSGINQDNINVAISSANRLRSLVAHLADLDPSGVTLFAGLDSSEEGAIFAIAQAMATFSDYVSEIDTGAVSVSVSCATRLKDLINSLVDLDDSGVSKFSLVDIGNKIKNYINYVKDIDANSVYTSITAAERLKNLINNLADLDDSGVSKFLITNIGTRLKTYANSVAGIDVASVISSISAAKSIKNFISSLAGLDTSGVSSFTESISTLGQANVSGLEKTFSSVDLSSVGSNLMSSLTSGMKNSGASLSNTANTMIGTITNSIGAKSSSFSTAGGNLMANLVKGIQSKASLVKVAASATVSGAAGGVMSQYSKFYANGRYLGEGLVVGINSKKSAVYWAAYELGQRAVQGEKDGQKSKSPSKLTEQAGKWFGEGLIIGIDSMGTKVYRAGHAIGDTAVKSLSTAMARTSELVNEGMFDNQPTIRPVLDLSDVKAGAGNISNLLGMGQTIGVSANVGAVSASMNSRIQNGGNGDVVSAINKLSKQLSNVGGSTYNVNGVTYDDGTNVSNAVQSLIRAAKIEGRA